MPASQWVSGQLVWAWTTLILVSITWVRLTMMTIKIMKVMMIIMMTTFLLSTWRMPIDISMGHFNILIEKHCNIHVSQAGATQCLKATYKEGMVRRIQWLCQKNNKQTKKQFQRMLSIGKWKWTVVSLVNMIKVTPTHDFKRVIQLLSPNKSWKEIFWKR